jgi:hypothetical protein
MLHARVMGYSGTVDAAHIADLMDAVHNILALSRNGTAAI